MTLRFLSPGAAIRCGRLPPWAHVTAALLLLGGCAAEPPLLVTAAPHAAQPPSSGTAAVPHIQPLREQLQQLEIAFAAGKAQHAQLLDLARERYPQHFVGSADGRTLITLMLDDEGHVTASDFVNAPSHWFDRNAEVEPRRFYDRAFDFLASQRVPPEQARSSTSFVWITPPSGRFFVSPPSTRPELMLAVYDPARRWTFDRPRLPQIGASPETVRAIITMKFPDLYENPSGDTREWIWALMDSHGDLLTAGREPEPNVSGRARILESRYPGIKISGPPLDASIRDADGNFVIAHGDQLTLTVYWLDPDSPLP